MNNGFVFDVNSSNLRGVMVSAAIPQLGKTSHYLTEQDVRVDSTYYCDRLLSQLIPEMTALSGGDFISQQDGVFWCVSVRCLAGI